MEEFKHFKITKIKNIMVKILYTFLVQMKILKHIKLAKQRIQNRELKNIILEGSKILKYYFKFKLKIPILLNK